jgi:CBS domain-containing protein
MISTRAGRDAHALCNDPEVMARELIHLPTRATSYVDGRRQSVLDYTPVEAIMSSDVTCVRDDVSVEDLTALLLERGISGVPVVDDSGALIGVVSKTDVVREGFESAGVEPLGQAVTRELGAGFHSLEIGQRTVKDIMSGMNFALPEDATLSQACALMAYEGVHRVPVTGVDGSVVGILSSLDILRWVAARDGYLVRA